jgi:hypothetical protein
MENFYPKRTAKSNVFLADRALPSFKERRFAIAD